MPSNPQLPPTSQLPSQTNHDEVENAILAAIFGAMEFLPQGESLQWANLIWIYIFTVIKKILTESDELVRQTAASNPTVPLTGTYDTTDVATLSSAIGSQTLLPLLNRFLAAVIPPDARVIGPTRCTHVDWGTFMPLIHRIQIQEFDLKDQILIIDLETSFTTTSVIEIDTSLDVAHNGHLIATMPLQAALSNIFVHSTLRIAIDLGSTATAANQDETTPVTNDNTTTQSTSSPTANDSPAASNKQEINTTANTTTANPQNDDASAEQPVDEAIPAAPSGPSISFCLLEPPSLRFDLASAMGYYTQIINPPAIHALLHKGIMLALTSYLIAPKMVSIPISPGLFTYLAQGLAAKATGQTASGSEGEAAAPTHVKRFTATRTPIYTPTPSEPSSYNMNVNPDIKTDLFNSNISVVGVNEPLSDTGSTKSTSSQQRTTTKRR